MKRLFIVFLPLMNILATAAPPNPEFSEEYRNHTWRRLNPSNDSGLTDDSNIWFTRAHNRFEDTNELGRSSKNNLMLLKKFQSLHALVILIQFTDHRDRQLPTRDEINTLWNGDENFVSEDLPTGSIHRYFFRNSYGKMNIQASVADWTYTDNTEKYYSFGASGFGPGRVAPAAYPALDKLDREGYDFSRHDLDGDMVIDTLVVSILQLSYGTLFFSVPYLNFVSYPRFNTPDTPLKLGDLTAIVVNFKSASGRTRVVIVDHGDREMGMFLILT
jgi:hypothetical protein